MKVLFMRILAALCLLVFGGAALRAAPDLQRFEYKQYHMGNDVRIVVYAPDQDLAERACRAAFDRFAELDDILSDYRANSELMRLCAHAGGPPVRVSRDLYVVLERSQQVARQSDGAFDVTCSPVVRLWRTARKTHLLPTRDAIRAAVKLVGWRNLRLDPRTQTAQLMKPGMQLDVGGIGKGYADDCAQQVLRKFGITRALVEAGGDIVVTDAPPGRDGWSIEVPNAGKPGEPPVMTFANCAVSTSGDTEQFVDIGGKRYSHIVEPHTGMALTDRIEVTIIARDGLTSDGLSTAVSVLGPEKGQALARQYPGTKAYIRRMKDEG